MKFYKFMQVVLIQGIILLALSIAKQYYPMTTVSILVIAMALVFINKEVREIERKLERIYNLYCDVLEEICINRRSMKQRPR